MTKITIFSCLDEIAILSPLLHQQHLASSLYNARATSKRIHPFSQNQPGATQLTARDLNTPFSYHMQVVSPWCYMQKYIFCRKKSRGVMFVNLVLVKWGSRAPTTWALLLTAVPMVDQRPTIHCRPETKKPLGRSAQKTEISLYRSPNSI